MVNGTDDRIKGTATASDRGRGSASAPSSIAHNVYYVKLDLQPANSRFCTSYSQPVLYSHFKSKADIMAAVATRGFEELATRMEAETRNVAGTGDVLRNVCAAYLDFASSRPVVYEAMFVLPTQIKFASEETPAALRTAFQALVTALGPDRQDPVFLAEVLWSALHGLVVLMQSKRIPAAGADARLNILVQKFKDDGSG